MSRKVLREDSICTCGVLFKHKVTSSRKYCSQRCYWNSLIGKKMIFSNSEQKRLSMLGKNVGKKSWIAGKTYDEVYSKEKAWESELKDSDKLKEKLLEFHKE